MNNKIQYSRITHTKKSPLLFLLMLLNATVYAENKSKELVPVGKITIAEECSQLFKETEKIISEAEQQPGIHKQVQKIKSEYTASKAEILKLDLVLQEKSCKKALLVLEKIKQRY